MNISIVIPIFNEVESLPSLVEELDMNLEKLREIRRSFGTLTE